MTTRPFTNKIFLVVVVISALTYVPAPMQSIAAGPWYVAPGGNDSNTCLTPVAACATIRGAQIKASSGDTIYVATGTYTKSSGEEVVLLTDKQVDIHMPPWEGLPAFLTAICTRSSDSCTAASGRPTIVMCRPKSHLCTCI